MKKLPLTALLIILAGSILYADSDAGQKRLFNLAIWQNGKYITPEGNRFDLEPAPFKIEVSMADGEELFANFQTSDNLYRAVVEGRNFRKILGFDGTGLAESIGNENRDIWLQNRGWQVWTITGDGPHRFDQIRPGDGKRTGIRTVEHLYSLSDSGNVEFTEVDQIYCVICDIKRIDWLNQKLKDAQGFILNFQQKGFAMDVFSPGYRRQ